MGWSLWASVGSGGQCGILGVQLPDLSAQPDRQGGGGSAAG